MNKAKGITTIRGKEPLRKFAACSIEYDMGELYFDRTGRVVRQLGKSGKGWHPEAKIAINQTQMLNSHDELVLIFAPNSAVVRMNYDGKPKVIEDDEAEKIADQAQLAFNVIVDEFELSNIQKIEYREFYHFSFETLEGSEEWIKNLGLVTVADGVYKHLGKHYAIGWSIMTVADECRYRLEVRGVERNASVPVGEAELQIKESRASHLGRHDILKLMKLKREKQTNPEYSAVVDISAFLWDELPADFDVRGFVAPKVTENLSLFRKCFPGD